MLSVLGEIGQFVRPMSEAPRDGRKILGQSAGGLVICYWDAKPLKLAGPTWVDAPDAERGYLDKYFTGWLDPAKLKLLDYAALADLLIAYIDDARERSRRRRRRAGQLPERCLIPATEGEGEIALHG